jgi:glycosyltransferase involved in cell wall biosynthesis
MSDTKKVLCLFDYGCNTGFSTVSTNIKREIKNHFKESIHFDICAINYHGEPYQEKDGSFVVSASKSAPKWDDFGRFGFLKLLKEYEYDGIFILQDLAVVRPIIEHLKFIKDEKRKNNQKSFKSIFYFPVDCSLFPKSVEGLEFFDTLVTYTEFGKKEVIKFKPELKTKIKVVPHGTNIKEFYPLPKDDVKTFRDSYFGKNADKFIITNVNRNQTRKDIPTTIFAFWELKNMCKIKGLQREPFLYLHMKEKDPMGWDLDLLLSQTTLVKDVDYKIMETNDALGTSVETLNAIYNASDVFLTTTLGEGWGLTITEAMATKKPIVCPIHTSLSEITNFGNWVYGIHEFVMVCNTTDNTIRYQCDYMDVAHTLSHLMSVFADTYGETYKDCQRKIEQAYQWCSALNWKSVCLQWYDHFKNTY